MASVPNYRPDTANNTPKCPADTATQNFPGHRSSLPTSLYLLSFSPAFPPIRRAPHQPRLLILHPYTLYAIGAIAAFIAGSQRSLNSLLFGLYWLDGINKDGVDRSRIEEVGRVTGLVFIPIAAVTLALRFAMSLPFTIAAETLCRNLKLQYLEAVFAQDAAYFDVHGSGEIAAKATHDVAVIQKGLGEKVGFLIWNLGTGITCIIIAYVMSPRLAAVLTASLTLVIAILVFTTLKLDRGHKSPTASCSTVNGPNTRASETLPVERGDPAAMQSPPRLVSRFRDLVSRREGWRMLALPVGFLIATGITATDCIHAILVGYGISSLTEVADQGAALNRYALLSLLSGVLAFVLRIISTNCLEILKERIQRRLNGEIMSAVLSRNAAFFDTPEGDAGALSAAMANHIEKTSASIGMILSQASYTVALNIAGIAVIMAFSWKIGLVAVASIILTAMSVVLHVLAQRRYERPKGDKNVNPAINQLSDAARVISSLGIYKQAAKHVEMQMDGTSERYRGMAIVSAVGSVPWALIFLEFGMIMWWSAHLYARGEATIRKAIIILIMFSSVTAQTATSTHLTTELAQGLASWRYIKESYLDKRVVSSPPREGNADLHDIRPGSVIREWCGAEINLRSVSMAYPGAVTNALNDLTLNIPAGQRTAIAGASGSGKSTLFAVLQRFYPCQSGSIQFDGQDYLSIPINHLRKRIAVVSQAAVLFEGDIRFNLCLGAPEPESVTQAELEWACKQACILDFVKGLPEGFDTDIGLKGTRLSGGQKQRLCIARALISKADILLLDEATSALDATIEGAVEEALRNASRGRTTLVIAHKLQSLLSADHIVVMSHGCVVEQGTHNKLIAVEGEYKRLVETQMS